VSASAIQASSDKNRVFLQQKSNHGEWGRFDRGLKLQAASTCCRRARPDLPADVLQRGGPLLADRPRRVVVAAGGWSGGAGALTERTAPVLPVSDQQQVE
jgi:hypothetical protein